MEHSGADDPIEPTVEGLEHLRQRQLRWLSPRGVAAAALLLVLAGLLVQPLLSPAAARNLLLADSLCRGEGLTLWGQPLQPNDSPGTACLWALARILAGPGPWASLVLKTLLTVSTAVAGHALLRELGDAALARLAVLVIVASVQLSLAAGQPLATAPTACLATAALFAWVRALRTGGMWWELGTVAWLAASGFDKAALAMGLGAAAGLFGSLGAGVRRRALANVAVLTAGGLLVATGFTSGITAFELRGVAGETLHDWRIADLAGAALSAQPISILLAAACLWAPIACGAAALWRSGPRLVVSSLAAYLLFVVLMAPSSAYPLVVVLPTLAWCLLDGLPRLATILRLRLAHAAALPLLAAALLVALNLGETLRQVAEAQLQSTDGVEQALRETAEFLRSESAAGDRFAGPEASTVISCLSGVPYETDSAGHPQAVELPPFDAGQSTARLLPLIVVERTAAPGRDAKLRQALDYHPGYTLVFRNRHWEVYRRLDATAARILADRRAAPAAADQPATPPRMVRRDRSVKR